MGKDKGSVGSGLTPLVPSREAVGVDAMPSEGALVITMLGGNCPVQAEGTLCGLPFYFRARGDSWSFSVAAVPDGDPVNVYCGFADGFHYEEDYGDGPFDAGWMHEAEARAFIDKGTALYLESLKASQTPPASDGEARQAKPAGDRTQDLDFAHNPVGEPEQ